MNPENRKLSRRLVFLDIDGTLASRMNYVPRSAQKACQDARKNGHLLYIASGRSRVQISEKTVALGFDGIISSGGACIEADGNVIFREPFSPSLISRLLNFLDERGAGYVVESYDKVTVNQNFSFCLKKLTAPLKWREFFNKTASEGMNFDRENVLKLVFMESAGLKFDDAVKEFGAECEICKCSIPLPGITGGEISVKGVHKGSAAEKVARYYGIRREDTLAFGDSDNDRTMLEYAGVGIAMGNGDEELKRIADDVTGTAGRGGLAAAFKKYGLA